METIDYKKIIDLMVSGLYVYDFQTQKNVFINREYTSITGWTIDELNGFGEAFIELFHEEDRDAILQHMKDLRESNDDKTLIVEYRFKTKEGDWIWCLSYDTPFERNQAGEVTRFIGSFADVSQLKEAEFELRESEERFRGAFETSPIGMALVSPEGKWIKVNKAISSLLGYSEDELLQKTFQDIAHPDDLEADLEYVEKMLSAEIENYEMEKRYFHKNGSIIKAILSVSLVWDNNGLPKHFISQIMDVTALKDAEEGLEKKLAELEAVNQNMIGREMRMEELKKEVDDLRSQLKLDPKYTS